MLSVGSKAALCALALLLLPIAAPAQGTVRVQQITGKLETYNNVGIQLVGKKLFLRSPDGKGELIIERAACFYIGELLRCHPLSVYLTQNGETHPLDLASGTIYANRTSSPLTLPYSSQQVQPNSIVMALQTKIGTFVSLQGTFDAVVK
jgi:hypothetical protein